MLTSVVWRRIVPFSGLVAKSHPSMQVVQVSKKNASRCKCRYQTWVTFKIDVSRQVKISDTCCKSGMGIKTCRVNQASETLFYTTWFSDLILIWDHICNMRCKQEKKKHMKEINQIWIRCLPLRLYPEQSWTSPKTSDLMILINQPLINACFLNE